MNDWMQKLMSDFAFVLDQGSFGVLPTITRVPCLAYIIQLALKGLLREIRITPTNEAIKAAWDEREDMQELNAIRAQCEKVDSWIP